LNLHDFHNSGAFATVSLALNKMTEQRVAVKDIDKKHFEAQTRCEKRKRKLEDEVTTLQKFA